MQHVQSWLDWGQGQVVEVRLGSAAWKTESWEKCIQILCSCRYWIGFLGKLINFFVSLTAVPTNNHQPGRLGRETIQLVNVVRFYLVVGVSRSCAR